MKVDLAKYQICWMRFKIGWHEWRILHELSLPQQLVGKNLYFIVAMKHQDDFV
jgi:hypothetical protein